MIDQCDISLNELVKQMIGQCDISLNEMVNKMREMFKLLLHLGTVILQLYCGGHFYCWRKPVPRENHQMIDQCDISLNELVNQMIGQCDISLNEMVNKMIGQCDISLNKLVNK
jgi:predicted HicB family RNase H-like nuclease